MWNRYRKDLAAIRPAAWRFLIGSALMGAAYAVPWTLLQLYLDRLAFSKAAIGGVQSAEAWGQVLVAVPGAILLARRRTPPLLVLSCIGTAAGFVLLPWLESALAMQACKVGIGVFWWLHYVAIAPFLFRHSEREERATLFGLAEAVHTGAAVIACFACGRAADLIATHHGDETQALGIVLSASGVIPLLAAVFYATIREDEPEVSARTPLLPILLANRGLFLRFVAPQWIVACGAGLCIPFLGLYFQDRFGRPPSTVGELYAAWQALATVGFLFAPILIRRLSFVWAMIALELLSIPFFLMLAFTQNYPLAVLAFLFRGALMNSTAPILKIFMMEASPAGTREVQIALNSTAWGVAWVVGPWLGGLILDWTDDSYAILMCTTVAFYVTASLSTLVLLGPLDPRRAR